MLHVTCDKSEGYYYDKHKIWSDPANLLRQNNNSIESKMEIKTSTPRCKDYREIREGL